jgi:hypothetical protein
VLRYEVKKNPDDASLRGSQTVFAMGVVRGDVGYLPPEDPPCSRQWRRLGPRPSARQDQRGASDGRSQSGTLRPIRLTQENRHGQEESMEKGAAGAEQP